MKGGVSLPPKRRWKGFVVAVLGLVILSMLVPLVFLLGLHNGFHSSGFASDSRSSAPVKIYDRAEGDTSWNPPEGALSRHVDELMHRLEPNLSKDVIKEKVEAKNKTVRSDLTQVTELKNNIVKPSLSIQRDVPKTPQREDQVSKVADTTRITEDSKSVASSDSEKLCELRFGSYCLWREEHREEMKDSMVKILKDRLFVARAYYPSIAKLSAQEKLSREMKQNIQEFERILSESTTDADLPSQIEKKLQRMGAVIARARSCPVDCNNVDKKLRQLVDLTEDEANFHAKQSAFLFQLAVQTIPKSHHCLYMRLTVEYFRSAPPEKDRSLDEKFVDPGLNHYVIFSNNVLAASVVVNSTVTHAKERGNLVFHILTNGQNYYAIKFWFIRNEYNDVAIQVLNIEDLHLDNQNIAADVLHLSMPEEYRVSFLGVEQPSGLTRTVYISVFSHSHYLLDKIFSTLKKVVVLDDDVVVQRDLSSLWDLDMEGKVNGAVEVCPLRLGLLKSYLGDDNFEDYSCVWMSGLNIIDLVRWREQDLSGRYQRLRQKQLGSGEGIVGPATLHASLLAFQNLIYPIDGTWALSGLGHDYGVDEQKINEAAVLHYNGQMKPWLEIGIPRYKSHWKRYLNHDDLFLGQCNVNS
ncbi:Glycosyl transferase, family 8 [Dillenia turbinata]|uniref:Hexosyltransferase n=1 Tax=Dillenia turbinata TaxID=194707 RepID=A0AAN8W8L3_9MAGN